ncbi:MAG TPA: histone deacetylase [Gemmatimonadales bacterium]|nr:histone deacetylase [Gemmatimonadales bacterium]
MGISVVWHPRYEVDIGPHVFPTAKYRLVREGLLAAGTVAESDLVLAVPASDEQVRLVHTAEYVEKIRSGRLSAEERAVLEVPFSAALREASWLCAGGSILAARAALRDGVAAHLGGGFHHAFADHGEGFCLINDVAIAIQALRREGAIRRAVVIDLDVHHGNGTAAIFAAEPDVFTFSMHQENNYPAWKPPGDLDIALPDGIRDREYLELLEPALERILPAHRPELAFYLAGADPYLEDQLGGLGLTLDGLRRRDALVFEHCRRSGVPVAVVLAGGYALDRDDTISIHCATIREACSAAAAWRQVSE